MSDPRGAHPALGAWAALRASGAERGALVTLVRGDGGAARALGTHFALADDGQAFGSLTVGGCADGRALEAAGRVLAHGRVERLTLPLGEADALALGLGCAGDVELVVDRVSLDASDPSTAALDAALECAARGERAVLATPLAPGRAGRLLVRADGGIVGGSGGGAGHTPVADLAVTMNAQGTALAAVHEVDGEEWFLEPLAAVRTLLVIGATEIAAALGPLVVPLGWRMVLLDTRDDLLAQERFAPVAERIACIPADVVHRRVRGVDAPAVVVVAHDYRMELPVLRAALEGDAPYVGMLGSRRRGAAMREMLADDGVAPERVARLRSPIGLAIGAEGPAEIAVSIVAELVATWRGAMPRA